MSLYLGRFSSRLVVHGSFYALMLVVLSFSHIVNAQFREEILFLAKEGEGTVRTRPSGLFCGITCEVASASFDFGDFIEVVATPAAGWVFSTWTGACSGVEDCNVTMNTTRTVGVIFEPEGANNPPDDPPPNNPPEDPPTNPRDAIPAILPILSFILSTDP